jgi:hypothetical protein
MPVNIPKPVRAKLEARIDESKRQLCDLEAFGTEVLKNIRLLDIELEAVSFEGDLVVPNRNSKATLG